MLNAGAVAFYGVVDEYLFRADALLGQPAATGWLHSAESCYQRIGARWWSDRLAGEHGALAPEPTVTMHFRHGAAAGSSAATALRTSFRTLKACTISATCFDILGWTSKAPIWRPLSPAIPALTISQGDADVIDAQALAAYRRRLADVDAELSEAESWADEGRSTRLQLEREALLDEIGAAAGLGGRRRRFSSAQERARVSVRKAIAATLGRIAEHDAALARHLRDAVRTGSACRYDPDPGRPVVWILEA